MDSGSNLIADVTSLLTLVNQSNGVVVFELCEHKNSAYTKRGKKQIKRNK
jgi:hypothetical protein